MTLGDEPAGQLAVAGHPDLVDLDPVGVLDRTVVEVGHADRERRHVVHEEVGEVLGGDDDDRVGPGRLERLAHLVEGDVQALAQRRVGLVVPAPDARCMAADTGEHEWHHRLPSSPTPCAARPC